MHYQIIKIGKEEIGLVWRDRGEKTKIEKIYLPDAKSRMADKIGKDFPAADKKPGRIPDGIDEVIAGLYEGRKLNFDFSLLNLSGVSDFSFDVLKNTFRIPRGKVMTYSGLAGKVGAPKAARAVGTVMANNPFPIVIPCHRVIRADGSVGQFGGGSDMKKRLLAREGIILDARGTVPAGNIRV